DHVLVRKIHAAILTGNELDAAAMAEPVRHQLAERRVLEPAVHDDRADLLGLREIVVVVQRVEVTRPRRILHQLRYVRPLAQLRQRIAFLNRLPTRGHGALLSCLNPRTLEPSNPSKKSPARAAPPPSFHPGW